MCEKELLNHRNSFIEGNLSETRCIETCSVCLRLFVNVFAFFALNSFEDVESKTFIVRLSVERVIELRCPQRSSFPAASATAADGPREKTARGRTPLHFAAINGHVAAAEFLVSKGAAVDAKKNTGPGPQRQGPENRGSTTWGISEGFPSLEILRKMFEFSAKVVQNREFPALNMQKMLGSMITCSVLII